MGSETGGTVCPVCECRVIWVKEQVRTMEAQKNKYYDFDGQDMELLLSETFDATSESKGLITNEVECVECGEKFEIFKDL